MSSINLNLLKEVSGNDEFIINRTIDIFEEKIPTDVTNLINSINTKDWRSVKTLSHKLKSSFNMIGAEKQREMMLTIEKACYNDQNINETDEITFGVLLKETQNSLDEIIAELKKSRS